MFRILYDLFLILTALVASPLLLRKKYRRTFKDRFGVKIPSFSLPSTGKRIWIHAVSVGETRAVVPLARQIKNEIPDAVIFFSSTTETGQSEAKRSMPNLHGYFLLPFDFSWNIKRVCTSLKPDMLILVEGDLWYNLVRSVEKVILVNGKISERSARRFKLIPFFTRRLFSHFKIFCVQSRRYADRFEKLGVSPQNIVVTGNLKFDMPLPHIDKDKWKADLGIGPTDQVITLGSTHELEEKEILVSLESIWAEFPHLKVLVVPRHPDRFERVARQLQEMRLPFCRFSHLSHRTGEEKVILIDAMGILNPCYQLSDLAIVGGSFVPGIGGHNIFEPVSLQVPTLFGPHMESQRDLVEIILQAGAGKQVHLAELSNIVRDLLRTPPTEMKKACRTLAEEVHGSTARTWAAIKNLF